LIPELVGRFPILTKLNDLTEEQFVSIMKTSKRSVTKQYQELFLLDGVELELLDEFYLDVAKSVKKSKVGARGVRSLCEECFKMLMFYLPKINKKSIKRIEVRNLTAKPVLDSGTVTEEFQVDKFQ
jgi:ATP-dependent Clp protease ATP-binding subunit ClpX